AQSVAEFATTADTEEATARAKGLAEWAQQADQFAKALELACAAGSVQLTSDEEGQLVVRWDRQKNELTVRTSPRNRKEDTIAGDQLTVEQWLELANQVETDVDGGRECFVGLLAINKHCRAATSYLA